jgi:Fe-S cluster assembly protein SufD
MTFTPGFLALDGGPSWLRDVRTRAAEELADLPFPVAEEEVWRYSRIADLDVAALVAPPVAPSGGRSSGAVSDLVAVVDERAALVATDNGRVMSVDVDDVAGKAGLVVRTSDTTLDGDAFRVVDAQATYFRTLNAAAAADPIVIDVPAGAVVEAPVVVVHWFSGDQVLAAPRLVVRAGDGSQVTVCEVFVSDDSAVVVVPVTEVAVGVGANVRYAAVQQLGESAWQIGHQLSEVASSGTFRSTTVALGGSYARVETDSRLVGDGAASKLEAVYFGSGSSVHDFRTLQDHRAPKTHSDLLFKGAVGNTARSVYSGLIRVEKGAAGTNAFQTNRNLVLSPGAHSDSVPNLEIEENDVKCSHASATGPIDEEQRYYLESRGVPTDVAERLIVLGFLDEVVSEVPVPGLRDLLRSALARKLNDVEAAR